MSYIINILLTGLFKFNQQDWSEMRRKNNRKSPQWPGTYCNIWAELWLWQVPDLSGLDDWSPGQVRDVTSHTAIRPVWRRPDQGSGYFSLVLQFQNLNFFYFCNSRHLLKTQILYQRHQCVATLRWSEELRTIFINYFYIFKIFFLFLGLKYFWLKGKYNWKSTWILFFLILIGSPLKPLFGIVLRGI